MGYPADSLGRPLVSANAAYIIHIHEKADLWDQQHRVGDWAIPSLPQGMKAAMTFYQTVKYFFKAEVGTGMHCIVDDLKLFTTSSSASTHSHPEEAPFEDHHGEEYCNTKRRSHHKRQPAQTFHISDLILGSGSQPINRDVPSIVVTPPTPTENEALKHGSYTE